ncbi:MAG: DNA polymerase III subunit alpha [bacterium]
MHTFVHLHTHSNFSLLDGTMPIRTLVERTKALGMSALALTDHNGLYGAIEFYRLCREFQIKPIIGAQISLQDNASLILLAKSIHGYENLCEIITAGHLRGGHLNFECDMQDILTYKEELIVLSGGKKGLISQLLLSRNFAEAESHCRWMKEQFKKNFYLELQRFLPWDDLLNERLQEISRKCGVPLVATNDVHLLSPGDLPLRQVLHAIDQNTLRERVRTAGTKEQYLKSPAQMATLFANFPETIKNSQRIADACNIEFSLGKSIFPVMQVPEGYTGESYLRHLCFQGARACYQSMTPDVVKRLTYELDIINKLGFTEYFLIVKDIVDYCRREGIPCAGRGSAADSIVSYVLGITFADPLRFNLYFERFLNPERTDAPDIDLDICWCSRDDVIDYVYKKYGSDKTAMICTFSTFQSRAAIREVAKTFGLPEEEIGELTRKFPYMARVANLDASIKNLPELKNQIGSNGIYNEIIAFSKRLANFPRHLSIHAGGVIIAPDRLTKYTPLELARKGIAISQYDMYSIERLGLVKMDLLGVRSLSTITECIESVRKSGKTGRLRIEDRESRRKDNRRSRIEDRKSRGRYLNLETEEKFNFLKKTKKLSPLDMRAIPEDDPETIRLIKSGNTIGCFQLESPLVRGVIRKMQTDSLEDTVVTVAVIRPGVGDSLMKDEYILRRGGLRRTQYAHPLLEPVLRETHGLTIYQEQILLIAKAVAGFTLAEGDTLRRAMTKARNEELMNSMRDKFISGAMQKGVGEEKALEIWQYLRRVTGFSFNKAHAATYGILAYQTAFLKRYFPIEFMTAVLNNHGGFYATAVYIEECRRLGIPLLPPDINCSQPKFAKQGESIRVGLNSVFELSDRTKKRLVEERQKKPFKNLYDFLRRTNAGQKEVEHLIRCGAFRSLNQSEPLLLMKAQSYFKNGCNKNITEYLTACLDPSPYSQEERILNELELLGFGVSAHPLTLYDDLIPWENMVCSLELESHKNRRIQFTGWYVTSRLQETVTGKYMKFLSLEDKQGICETIFFPEVYERHAEILRGPGPFTVTGKIQSRIKGEANLIAEKVIRWPSPREVVNSRLNGQQLDVFGQAYSLREVA